MDLRHCLWAHGNASLENNVSKMASNESRFAVL